MAVLTHSSSLVAISAALMLSSPAHAQVTQSPATGTGNVQVAEPEPQGQPEIIVTANRREERIQSVALSITALSQETLRDQHITNINDLQYATPGMSVSGQSRDLQAVSVRGQGQSTQSSPAGVVVYQNEVPLCCDANGQTFGGPGLYYDLDNVQVLKGPQGTLFGRNSVGGAVLIQTKRPTDDFGGYLEGTVGNYRNREVSGALNVPLIGDKLLLRIAGSGQWRRGYTQSLGAPNHPNGIDLDDVDYVAGRATLTYRPTDSIQTEFIYNYYRARTNGNSQILTHVNPDPALDLGLQPLLAQQRALGPRIMIAQDTPAFATTDYHSIANITTIELSSSITLRNIASFSKYDHDFGSELDGTDLPILNYPSAENLSQQYTEELQVQGKAFDDTLSYTVGAFYLNSPPRRFADQYNIQFFAPLLNNPEQYSYKSFALYSQASYALTAGLKVTAGFRYTWDTTGRSTRNLDGSNNCLTPLPFQDATCTAGATAKFSAPAWTIGLDYQISPRILTYIVSRRAYKSGGFSSSNVGILPFQPEYNTDIEAGLKSDFKIGQVPVRFNAAVYHQWYKDIQVLLTPQLIGGQFASIIQNGANAGITGAEIEARISPTPNLTLGGTFAWLDFKYTSFSPLADITALRNAQYVNRPRYKYGLSARYELPLGDRVGKPYLGANWNWQSTSGSAVAFAQIPAYGLLTLNAGWDGIGGLPIDAAFFMTNATNIVRPSFVLDLYDFGFNNATLIEPRTFGFRLRYRFGSEGR